jgi:hypothetical protein
MITDEGLFLPTTQVWNVAEIYDVEGLSPSMRELMVRMYHNLNRMAMAVNAKDSGVYQLNELACGQIYPPIDPISSGSNMVTRNVYRTLIDFGRLPTAVEGSKKIAHGLTINDTTQLTRLYGAATQPSVSMIPLPYPAIVPADTIELYADDTYVYIDVLSDWSLWTEAWIVLEYFKY